MGSRIAVMNIGLLQQIGTPQELYDHPANVFVAGFIGSPAMNFMEVTLDGSGERGRGSRRAPLKRLSRPHQRGRCRERGRPLIMGNSAEHFQGRPAGPTVGTVRANVDVVEYLGNEELLHLRGDEQYIVAVVDADLRVRPDDVLDLQLLVDYIYLFDPGAATPWASPRSGGQSRSPPAPDPEPLEQRRLGSATLGPRACVDEPRTGRSFGRSAARRRRLVASRGRLPDLPAQLRRQRW